jgi:2-methylcitrate dehydratase PrpD
VALTRDLSDPLVYNDAAVWDPVVRDLAQRIELEPLEDALQESPGVWPTEVLLECGGRRHTLQTKPYKGSPRNPFTWAEACEKFRRYTASVLGPPRATAIVDAVGGLERVTDMADVARLVMAS